MLNLVRKQLQRRGDMKKKVTFIGAGSISFTRTLLTDILTIEELQSIDISFMDINEENLRMVTELCQRDIDSNKLDIKINATTSRKEALRGANYVILCIRQGGLEAFKTDIEIPLKYGIDQCVGDTLCAGGIMYGQRGINEVLQICNDIREEADDNVLLLNYANPNAMITWACNHYGGVNTLGLCHGVQHGHQQLADIFNVEIEDVDIICAGINHQTWYTQVLVKGEDRLKDVLEAFKRHPQYSVEEKVRIDVLEKFGYYSTESNGHLSEYLPWYRSDVTKISDWIDLDSSWINGETGGYLRVCTESRNWFEEDFPAWMNEEPKKYVSESRSNEHGSYIIEGLETGRVYRGHFNVVNNGIISNLMDEAIVEVPGYVDRNGINLPVIGDLPHQCAAICSNSINVQKLAVEAAIEGNVQKLKQAMLLDPLCGAVCDTNEICQMTEEMLIAQKQWLPQYSTEIEGLEKKWETIELIPTNSNFNGACRKDIKTIEELKVDTDKMRALVSATEKGGM